MQGDRPGRRRARRLGFSITVTVAFQDLVGDVVPVVAMTTPGRMHRCWSRHSIAPAGRNLVLAAAEDQGDLVQMEVMSQSVGQIHVQLPGGELAAFALGDLEDSKGGENGGMDHELSHPPGSSPYPGA